MFISFILIPGSSAASAIFLLCIHKPWRRQKYFKALRPAIFLPKIVAFEGGLLHLALSGIISLVNSTTSFKLQLHTVIPKQYIVSHKLLAWFLGFFFLSLYVGRTARTRLLFRRIFKRIMWFDLNNFFFYARAKDGWTRQPVAGLLRWGEGLSRDGWRQPWERRR